ncbi:hypothetical protein F3Y22_tig00004779pilonHSYRG00149 [Hibiscus syriacus]|uniref:Malectin-like domain-containing protein n=1 Tax=Hibiscus syriacus TaxID=106335 RepID=A0A6A3CFQ2_HIBSY|nr:hypothetical protein F3Y22_tig00004779pilonHSYRG00149 [Hibiscus syriacus]
MAYRRGIHFHGGARYLIRTTYYYGRVNGLSFPSPPVFDQMVDGTFWRVVNTTEDYQKGKPSSNEAVFEARGTTMSICVAPNTNLNSMGASGSLSSSIANLTSLRGIWLGNNSLSGVIPDLSSLKLLEILHLEDNQFNGDIPSSLGDIGRLRELMITLVAKPEEIDPLFIGVSSLIGPFQHYKYKSGKLNSSSIRLLKL